MQSKEDKKAKKDVKREKKEKKKAKKELKKAKKQAKRDLATKASETAPPGAPVSVREPRLVSGVEKS